MLKVFQETNEFLERCFNKLEKPFPSPTPTMLGKDSALRYEERFHCLQLVILQKLARYISGLNASLVLLQEGYAQEIGVIFRTIDEFGEDMMFLSLPLITDMEATQTHEEYLVQHFQEEFDIPDNPMLSTQKRATIPRKKIQAVIAKNGQGGLNPSDTSTLFHTLGKTYSGYVHGANTHICEMIGNNPPTYFLSGMAGTLRQTEFIRDYWNYSYRGLINTVLAAKALGEAQVVDDVYAFIDYFEKCTSQSGTGDAEKLMKEIKAKD